MLELSDYRGALLAQSACNLSGLVHTLSGIVSRIWEDPECTGTDFVNKHPIVVLYSAQIAYLSGLGIAHNMDAYSEAYKVCEARSMQ